MIYFNNLKKKTEFLENVRIIRTFKRFKTITIRVKKGEPEILCPHFTSKSFLQRLIKKRTGWIKNKMREYSKLEEEINQIDNGYVKVWDRDLKLIYKNGKRQNFELKRDRLVITLNGQKEIDKKRLIRDWLKSEAEKYLKKRLVFLSKKVDIDFNTLKIKSYISRWGSCSNRGEICLNWKLMMLPKEIIDYVIIHELVHILVPNHSKKFWNKVSEKDRTFQEKREWLRKNGMKIIQFR
jgi:hypothetical protein